MSKDTEGLRIDALIGSAYEITKFRDLPLPHKMAMAWYMAVDGEAWTDVLDYEALAKTMPEMQSSEWYDFWKKALVDAMPLFDECYGDEKFGVVLLETESILRSIQYDEVNVEEGLDLDAIRVNYASGGRHGAYPEHGPTDRWPVILSSHDDDTLQDGWHRFRSYAGAGHPDVPAIFYPHDRHLTPKVQPAPTL